MLDQRFIKNVLTGNYLLFGSKPMVKLKAKIALSDKWSHFKLTSGLCILVHFISNVRFIIKYAKHLWKGWLNFSLTHIFGHDIYNSVKTFI